MADESYIRHSAGSAVRPSYQEPGLREGWGEGTERPARLTQHASADEVDVGSLAAVLGVIALVLVATGVIVWAFAF